MLAVQNLSCHFGDRIIFRDVNFILNDGERIAIVGPNGAGKSTLLRIIAGEASSDGGSISRPNDMHIGYLPQETDFVSERTLREELLSVFDAVHGYFDEMRELEHRMADEDHDAEEFHRIAKRYDFLQSEIHRLDAYSIDARIGETSAGLGFSISDLDRRCFEFSGGWRKRIVLAQLLLSNPDVLLLDEPTNHLDLETMLWVEQWIRDSKCACLMVSHERAFMNRLAHGILELAEGQFAFYKGNYNRYLELREERREHQQRAYENQQQKIRELEKFITRFRYNASKAALVQSRVKQLEKIERIPAPPRDGEAIHFQFPPADRSNKEVLVLRNATKAYNGHTVLKPFDFTLYRGERIALVGMNGAGKSTLLKLLAEAEPLTSGERVLGTQVTLEYFEQAQMDLLTSERTVLDECQSAASVTQAGDARNLLGAFLFRGDDVEKPVKVLSGGEKTRLRLAKMLFSRANCLLLDEPTNHLDLASRMTLENALVSFTGSIVIVSHDRVFLDKVATRVVEIRDGELHSYIGNFSDYLSATEGHGFLPDNVAEEARQTTGQAAAHASTMPEEVTLSSNGNGHSTAVMKEAVETPVAATPLSYEERKALGRKRKKLEREVEELEERASTLERKVVLLQEEMAHPGNATNPSKLQDLIKQHSEREKELHHVYAQWEKASREMEALGQ